MAYRPKYPSASEFGGVPGQYGNTDKGQPLSPELEQRAMYQAQGGATVYVNPDGSPAPLLPPSHGTGGGAVDTSKTNAI